MWERRTVVYRRLFHKYPEPGWLTFFATIFIAEHLEKAGFKVLVGREILKDEKRMDPPTEEETALWEQRAVKRKIVNRDSGIYRPGSTGEETVYRQKST